MPNLKNQNSMTLKDIVLTDSNHFIALERHHLFKKSVYLVLVVKDYLIGLQLNNRLNLESTPTLFSKTIAPEKALERGSEDNPYSYLKAEEVRRIEDKHLFDSSIFRVNKNNFRFEKIDITSINYQPNLVATLGYANMGEINIKTKGIIKNKSLNKSKRIDDKTLVILGKQHGNFFKSYAELLYPVLPESLS